jgi:hypothetical protein
VAKQGMKRPDPKEFGIHVPKNEVPPVPEIQGKAKTTKQRAKPLNPNGH